MQLPRYRRRRIIERVLRASLRVPGRRLVGLFADFLEKQPGAVFKSNDEEFMELLCDFIQTQTGGLSKVDPGERRDALERIHETWALVPDRRFPRMITGFLAREPRFSMASDRDFAERLYQHVRAALEEPVEVGFSSRLAAE